MLLIELFHKNDWIQPYQEACQTKLKYEDPLHRPADHESSAFLGLAFNAHGHESGRVEKLGRFGK